MHNISILIIWILVSPTRFLAKQMITHGLIVGIYGLAIWNLLFYMSVSAFYIYSVTNIGDKFKLSTPFLIYLAIFAIWRANELVIAFFNDAIDKAGAEKSRLGLDKSQLLVLFLLGYIEIIFQFGICHFCIEKIYKDYGHACAHTKAFRTALDAAYFSGVTVTTTGFGDFVPARLVARAVTVYEAIVGVVLIAMSLSAYLSYKQQK